MKGNASQEKETENERRYLARVNGVPEKKSEGQPENHMNRTLPYFTCLFILTVFGHFAFVAFCSAVNAEESRVVFETRSFRLEIGADATVASLTSKLEDVEYAWMAEPAPVAVVYRGGRSVPTSTGKYAVTGRWSYRGGQSYGASRVTRQRGRLRIEFAEADVVATYHVTVTEDYLAFRLVSLEGEPVDRIDLLRLNVKKLSSLGTWVNAASDDRFGICLWGGTLHTNAEMDRHADHTILKAIADRTPGFEGATAVLFGCSDPKSSFLDLMAIVERDFDMPAGAERRRQAVQRYSYLWAVRPTPKNVDEYIRWAKRSGFRMILFSYTDFSREAGHFDWNDSYPHGVADLKHVTDAIRRAGLKVGLHIHYSKAARSDRYVTPVPDGRLHKVRRFTLSTDIAPQSDVIIVDENPDGSALDDGRRILQAGDELIAYERYTTKPPFQFTGCRRGHLGTTSSAHRKGDSLGLLNVDTWPKFIRLDQNTNIQDEVARRIAEIYRQTGPYHMVYFDGAEDVHEPFWYHVASAQHRVYRLLDPPPPVCEAAHYTHFSWHMITRSNAYDIIAPADGMKDFCRLMPCPTAAERAKDFSRIDFGWLGRFGKSQSGYAGPDVWEYVASRAAAWDCPISLRVGLEDIASNPRAEDCLAAMKIWEDARLANQLTDAQRNMLKPISPEHAQYVPCFQQRDTWNHFLTGNLNPMQQQIVAKRAEHHLFVNERERYEMVEVEEIPNLADGEIKAFAFQRATQPADTYVLLWATGDDVQLRLPVTPDRLFVMRPFGNRLPIQADGDGALVPIGDRTYLRLIETDVQATLRLLRTTRRTAAGANPDSAGLMEQFAERSPTWIGRSCRQREARGPHLDCGSNLLVPTTRTSS